MPIKTGVSGVAEIVDGARVPECPRAADGTGLASDVVELELVATYVAAEWSCGFAHRVASWSDWGPPPPKGGKPYWGNPNDAPLDTKCLVVFHTAAGPSQARPLEQASGAASVEDAARLGRPGVLLGRSGIRR